MKNLTKTLSLLLVLTLVTASATFAQRGRGMGPCGGANFANGQAAAGTMQCRIPDLTEDQQAKIEALRVEHLKAVQPLKNQLNEYQAKYRTLMTEETIDTKAMDKLIDDRTAVMNKLMKLSTAHRADVRALLTDEQKVYFDSKERGPRMGQGMAQRGPRGPRGPHGNKGYGGGYGNCPRMN